MGSLQGIKKQLDLPAPYQDDPSNLSPQEAKDAGLEALPTSLAAALEALGHDTGWHLTVVSSPAEVVAAPGR